MATILVADDDRVTRAMLCGILSDCGHQALEAADGAQALELCKHKHFDMAFLDIFMPEKDGIQVIKTLVKEHPTISIVAMTGGSSFTSTEPLKWAKRYTESILIKPFQESQIRELLATL